MFCDLGVEFPYRGLNMFSNICLDLGGDVGKRHRREIILVCLICGNGKSSHKKHETYKNRQKIPHDIQYDLMRRLFGGFQWRKLITILRVLPKMVLVWPTYFFFEL